MEENINITEELNIKEELLFECTSSTPQPATSDEPVKAETSVKKRRMEIDLDYSLVKNEYYKPRDRRPVKRYDDILLEAEAKKNIDKIKKLQTIAKDTEESFFCNICEMAFSTSRGLKSHKLKHNRSTTFTCALCSATFNSNFDLTEHKIVHKNEERNYLCMKCELAFSDHCEYLKHNATHVKGTYFCIECGNEYDSRTSYIVHITTHYNKYEECDVCHKKFLHLAEHMKTHNANSKYVCVECGKEFANASYLKCHMTSHTGVKLFQCLYCGKAFANMSQRDIHTRYHTGERPYECKICYRTFHQTTDRNRHMENHMSSETKVNKCNVCNKTFKHKASLLLHMDVHNNTQKYSCSFCDYKNHTNTGMRSHVMRVHTEGRKFKCVPCNCAFKTMADLKKHSKNKRHINNVYGYEKKNKAVEE